jgi:two-component system, cell cycle response regulator CpdR
MTALNTYVLIAEDDPSIATIIERITQRMALTPIVVSDGAQAVETTRILGTSLACAICDMRMPVMSGLDAIVAIRAFNPDVPIVLMSADNYRSLSQQVALIAHVSFMQKPFAIADLKTHLDEVLHEKEPVV